MAVQDVSGEVAGPLREPAYRAWFVSQALSSAGLQTQNVAAAWLVFQVTHSGVALAGLAVVTMGPGLLLGAWAGGRLDRYRRRRVLLVTQPAFLVASTALGILALHGPPTLLAIYGLSLAGGVINAFDEPARQLIVTDLVGPARLHQAIPLYEVTIAVARAVGPALGGVLLGLVGAAPCFLVNAATFLAPIIVLALVTPRHESGTRPSADVRRTAALRFALHTPAVRASLAIAVLVGAIVGTAPYYPQFAVRDLGLHSTGYGLLVACLGIGSLPGAWVATRLGRATRGPRIALVAAGTAVATAFTGLAPSAGLAYLGVALIGLSAICLIALANTATQLLAPDALRGGVMGVWTMAIPGTAPITGLLIGVLVDAAGPRAVFFAIAAAMALVASTSWTALRDAPLRASVASA